MEGWGLLRSVEQSRALLVEALMAHFNDSYWDELEASLKNPGPTLLSRQESNCGTWEVFALECRSGEPQLCCQLPKHLVPDLSRDVWGVQAQGRPPSMAVGT